MDQPNAITPEAAARGWESMSPGANGSPVYCVSRRVPSPVQARLVPEDPAEVWIVAEPCEHDDGGHSWYCRVEFFDGATWDCHVVRGAGDIPAVSEILAQFSLWASGLVSAFLDASAAPARSATEAA